MASHNELGRIGEALGKIFLEEKAFEILHTNWKHSYCEIDIIASKNNILHFIEVKTRRSIRYGWPEESVDQKKLGQMMNAADEFLHRYPEWKRIQYDVLSISISADDVPDFFFIEDVYL